MLGSMLPRQSVKPAAAKSLAQYLLDSGAVDRDAIDRARSDPSVKGLRLDKALIAMQALPVAKAQTLVDEFVEQSGIPDLPASIRPFAHRDGLKLNILTGRLGLAAVQSWLDDVRRAAGLDVEIQECSITEFHELREGVSQNSTADLSAVRKVRQIISEAVGRGASDVHMTLQTSEVGKGGLRIQYRVNGSLEPGPEFLADEGDQMLRSMFQGMAAVADSTTRDLEDQHAIIIDPAFLRGLDGKDLGLSGIRLARAPLYSGMNLAARLLYAQKSNAVGQDRLGRLGYSERQLSLLQTLARKTEGINPITGPTGSGKSTTLSQEIWTILEVRDGVRIITIEDPVEYEFIHPNVWQYKIANANTDAEKAAAFAGKLKTALRQDPDIIMVGEIRGLETAKEAINAALTGHQVWTTLHVSDPFMIPQRLVAMGIDPFFLLDPKLLSSLIAQRLAKTLCPACSTVWNRKDPIEHLPSQDMLALTKWRELAPFARGIRLRGCGCDQCDRGYKGRSVVAQVVVTDEDLLNDIVNNGPMKGRANYMRRPDSELDMVAHGMLKVLDGQIDPRALVEVLGPIQDPPTHVRTLTENDI